MDDRLSQRYPTRKIISPMSLQPDRQCSEHDFAVSRFKSKNEIKIGMRVCVCVEWRETEIRRGLTAIFFFPRIFPRSLQQGTNRSR